MESLDDSNCPSLSDSFYLYERYMRSFNVVNQYTDDNNRFELDEPASSSTCDNESSNSRGNIDLSAAIQTDQDKHCVALEDDYTSMQPVCDIDNIVNKPQYYSETVLPSKTESTCNSLAGSMLETSSATADHSLLNDKSDPVISEVRVSSEESKSDVFKNTVFITSTMENSNNAVDSVPMFRDVRHSESIFKLPITELSFNGTIKHVQKLKPIVDPLSALSTVNSALVDLNKKTEQVGSVSCSTSIITEPNGSQVTTDILDGNTSETCRLVTTESNGDLQYDEINQKNVCQVLNNEDGSMGKWNLEQSYSSLEASFDSGVRSPDMFSDDDAKECEEPFWDFLKHYEAYDKRKVQKVEEALQGILPPPSVTTLKIDANEMLKKYYCYLPLFTDDGKVNPIEANSITPAKKVSFVEIPDISATCEDLQETTYTNILQNSNVRTAAIDSNASECEMNTSINDKSIEIKMCNEIEARETIWPDMLKCRYFDVYYNVSNYSEKYELLLQKYRERFVGGETDSSVNIYSGGLQSPSSACKRKALRLKMTQGKSPGRRLSHLARRRQAFCTAATINEKAQASSTKLVLIDKNFFPHRKLINSVDRKSPRTRRTPNKRTPVRIAPGKKTPVKTPKTKSGGSSRKKAMRRLLMDSETMSRFQSNQEIDKNALVSPESRKSIPNIVSASVPNQTFKFRRALFGSQTAETKSLDGTSSDQFLKRKRDSFDDEIDNGRSKIAKSLSFGGDSMNRSQTILFNRRASEVLSTKNTAELNETHKKKLLWAVSEALRVHGWRMSSPGFREKASTLARLTRRLLTLPPHAARLAAPKLSTSETMLKLARQYVFAVIQGRTVEECFQDEQVKLAQESNRISGYISATAYQQLISKKVSAPTTLTSQIKENTCNISVKQEQPRSNFKNILQDKLVNIDTNSSSSSGLSTLDHVGLYKSNSMPSFEDAAKLRVRRQISFDSVDFPKR